MDALQLFDWKNSLMAIDELEKLLQCAACGKVAEDPQRLGRCDHHFCRECADGLENGTCLACKVPAPPCEMQPDRIISDLKISCRDLRALITGGNSGSSGRTESGAGGPGNRQHTPERKNNNNDKPNNNNNSNNQQQGPGRGRSKQGQAKGSPGTGGNGENTKSAARKPRTPKTQKPSVQGRPTTTTTSASAATTPRPEKRPKGSATAAGEVKKIPRVSVADLSVLGMSPSAATLDKKNGKGETLLHVACIKGDRVRVKQLLSEGANPNTKDNAGWTPLHEVCSHGFEDIAELLLRHGAVVDPVGGSNATPLHDAVTQGQLGLIRLLRAWGASDTSRNLQGHTPRSLAKLCLGADEINAALDTPLDPSLTRPALAPPLMDKMTLLGTGLTRQQIKKLETLGRMLRVKVVAEYSPEVTHVVTECTAERLVATRTTKYMMGVVAGKWILSHTWMDECLRMESPVSPGEYEALGCVSAPPGAPVLGRANAEKLRPGLFSGCHIYLSGSFQGSSGKRELEGLVKAGGGTVLAREPNPEAIAEEERKVPFHTPTDSPLALCSHYIIYSNTPAQHPQIKYDMSHIKSLPLAWLYGCVDSFQLVPPVK